MLWSRIELSRFVDEWSTCEKMALYFWHFCCLTFSKLITVQFFALIHSIFGSLMAVKEIMTDLPPNVNSQYIKIAIRRRYSHVGNVFYFDNWPFVALILVTAFSSTAKQITQEHSLPKFSAMRNFFKPIAGKYDLITMKSPLWKNDEVSSILDLAPHISPRWSRKSFKRRWFLVKYWKSERQSKLCLN